MPPELRPEDLQAKVLAGRLLSLGAGRASAALDQFSSWLLAASGATFGLLLGSIEAVSKHINLGSLRASLWLFVAVLLCGVCSRLLAAIVGAGAAAAAEAEPMGRQLADEDVEVNFKMVFKEAQDATFWPVRLLVASSFARVQKGDLAAGGRLHAKLAQVQGIFVFLQVLLIVSIAGLLACGLAV